MHLKRVCVFCGSNPGQNPVYQESAVALSSVLLERGIGLVYGGASVGLMGLMADEMLKGGGEVIGVIPRILFEREVAHPGLTELKVVETMHERKALMGKLSDGFVALAGGFGTFEEICEVITWSQLGIHWKPSGLLNVNNYYTPLLQLFDQGVEEGFIRPEYRNLVVSDSDPAELLKKFERWKK